MTMSATNMTYNKAPTAPDWEVRCIAANFSAMLAKSSRDQVRANSQRLID